MDVCQEIMQLTRQCQCLFLSRASAVKCLASGWDWFTRGQPYYLLSLQ